MTTAVKAMLPFRAERSLVRGYPQIILHYQGIAPGGAKIELKLHVGPPLDDDHSPYYRDPLGVNILKLMQQFWELESQVEGILKERDQAVQQAAGLETALAEANDQLKRAQGRVRQLEQRNKSA